MSNREDIKASLERALLLKGHPPPEAEALADYQTDLLFEEFRGARLYFPLGQGPDRELRNAAIVSDHQNGDSMNTIANRYKISKAMVHKIVSAHKAP